MSMDGIKGNTSISTYQNLDGTNLTIAGVEEKVNGPKGSAGAFWALVRILLKTQWLF